MQSREFHLIGSTVVSLAIGRIWQTESFDHVLRSSESLDEKLAYVLNNPVRRGLVLQPEDYAWHWVNTSIAV